MPSKKTLITVVTLALAFTIPLQAFSYHPIGVRVRTLASDPEVKRVDFTIRNNFNQPIDGYYFKIRLFDREGQEILSNGRGHEGYGNVNIPPLGASRESVYIVCQAIPARVEVELLLLIPTPEGITIVR